MFTRWHRPALRRLIPVLASASLVGFMLAVPTAFGKVVFNTIDGAALVTDGGRHIVITGPLSCTAGERAFLRVTVTQRETGAIAEGHTLVRCSGDIRQWEVHATVRGAAVFQQGLATAAALARTSAHGDISDSHQWLVNITLVAD
jgi:hypothetical protein